PHPTHQSGGSSPRTAQRTRTPQTMQPPHTKGVLPPTSTPHTHAHTNPKRSMSDRCISTSQLNTLLRFHTWPINPIIYRTPLPTQMWAGHLTSEQATRLYAFSCYPSRSQPTSHAPGGTSGTPEDRPSRSSPTKDRPPHISYVRSG